MIYTAASIAKPKSKRALFSDLLCQSPFRNAVTYDLVRSLFRKGLFRASHLNIALFDLWLSDIEHDASFSKTVSRAAQPSVHRRCNRRLNAAAFRGPRRKYFRWGKAMRPRKPDGKLSRHGLGARRVALLAPRGVLSKYRHPLGYVGAITKSFGKVQK